MKRKIVPLALTLALLLCCPGRCAAFYDGEVRYSCRQNESMKIALTFDDGPHPRHTPEILSVLEEYGIKATFFVVGVNVENYPALVKAEADGGHEIGNHTWSHANLRKSGYGEVCWEIQRTEQEVYENTDVRCHLLRPPEGVYSEAVCDAARDCDYTLVLWSVDTRDWAHNPAEAIASEILTSIESGDIILFHDYISGDSPTVAALRLIIPALLEKGYRFVTVSELLASK